MSEPKSTDVQTFVARVGAQKVEVPVHWKIGRMELWKVRSPGDVRQHQAAEKDKEGRFLQTLEKIDPKKDVYVLDPKSDFGRTVTGRGLRVEPSESEAETLAKAGKPDKYYTTYAVQKDDTLQRIADPLQDTVRKALDAEVKACDEVRRKNAGKLGKMPPAQRALTVVSDPGSWHLRNLHNGLLPGLKPLAERLRIAANGRAFAGNEMQQKKVVEVFLQLPAPLHADDVPLTHDGKLRGKLSLEHFGAKNHLLLCIGNEKPTDKGGVRLHDQRGFVGRQAQHEGQPAARVAVWDAQNDPARPINFDKGVDAWVRGEWNVFLETEAELEVTWLGHSWERDDAAGLTRITLERDLGSGKTEKIVREIEDEVREGFTEAELDWDDWHYKHLTRRADGKIKEQWTTATAPTGWIYRITPSDKDGEEQLILKSKAGQPTVQYTDKGYRQGTQQRLYAIADPNVGISEVEVGGRYGTELLSVQTTLVTGKRRIFLRDERDGFRLVKQLIGVDGRFEKNLELLGATSGDTHTWTLKLGGKVVGRASKTTVAVTELGAYSYELTEPDGAHTVCSFEKNDTGGIFRMTRTAADGGRTVAVATGKGGYPTKFRLVTTDPAGAETVKDDTYGLPDAMGDGDDALKSFAKTYAFEDLKKDEVLFEEDRVLRSMTRHSRSRMRRAKSCREYVLRGESKVLRTRAEIESDHRSEDGFSGPWRRIATSELDENGSPLFTETFEITVLKKRGEREEEPDTWTTEEVRKRQSYEKKDPAGKLLSEARSSLDFKTETARRNDEHGLRIERRTRTVTRATTIDGETRNARWELEESFADFVAISAESGKAVPGRAPTHRSYRYLEKKTVDGKNTVLQKVFTRPFDSEVGGFIEAGTLAEPFAPVDDTVKESTGPLFRFRRRWDSEHYAYMDLIYPAVEVKKLAVQCRIENLAGERIGSFTVDPQSLAQKIQAADRGSGVLHLDHDTLELTCIVDRGFEGFGVGHFYVDGAPTFLQLTESVRRLWHPARLKSWEKLGASNVHVEPYKDHLLFVHEKLGRPGFKVRARSSRVRDYSYYTTKAANDPAFVGKGEKPEPVRLKIVLEQESDRFRPLLGRVKLVDKSPWNRARLTAFKELKAAEAKLQALVDRKEDEWLAGLDQDDARRSLAHLVGAPLTPRDLYLCNKGQLEKPLREALLARAREVEAFKKKELKPLVKKLLGLEDRLFKTKDALKKAELDAEMRREKLRYRKLNRQAQELRNGLTHPLAHLSFVPPGTTLRVPKTFADKEVPYAIRTEVWVVMLPFKEGGKPKAALRKEDLPYWISLVGFLRGTPDGSAPQETLARIGKDPLSRIGWGMRNIDAQKDPNVFYFPLDAQLPAQFEGLRGGAIWVGSLTLCDNNRHPDDAKELLQRLDLYKGDDEKKPAAEEASDDDLAAKIIAALGHGQRGASQKVAIQKEKDGAKILETAVVPAIPFSPYRANTMEIMALVYDRRLLKVKPRSGSDRVEQEFLARPSVFSIAAQDQVVDVPNNQHLRKYKQLFDKYQVFLWNILYLQWRMSEGNVYWSHRWFIKSTDEGLSAEQRQKKDADTRNTYNFFYGYDTSTPKKLQEFWDGTVEDLFASMLKRVEREDIEQDDDDPATSPIHAVLRQQIVGPDGLHLRLVPAEVAEGIGALSALGQQGEDIRGLFVNQVDAFERDEQEVLDQLAEAEKLAAAEKEAARMREQRRLWNAHIASQTKLQVVMFLFKLIMFIAKKSKAMDSFHPNFFDPNNALWQSLLHLFEAHVDTPNPLPGTAAAAQAQLRFKGKDAIERTTAGDTEVGGTSASEELAKRAGEFTVRGGGWKKLGYALFEPAGSDPEEREAKIKAAKENAVASRVLAKRQELVDAQRGEVRRLGGTAAGRRTPEFREAVRKLNELEKHPKIEAAQAAAKQAELDAVQHLNHKERRLAQDAALSKLKNANFDAAAAARDVEVEKRSKRQMESAKRTYESSVRYWDKKRREATTKDERERAKREISEAQRAANREGARIAEQDKKIRQKQKAANDKTKKALKAHGEFDVLKPPRKYQSSFVLTGGYDYDKLAELHKAFLTVGYEGKFTFTELFWIFWLFKLSVAPFFSLSGLATLGWKWRTLKGMHDYLKNYIFRNEAELAGLALALSEESHGDLTDVTTWWQRIHTHPKFMQVDPLTKRPIREKTRKVIVVNNSDTGQVTDTMLEEAIVGPDGGLTISYPGTPLVETEEEREARLAKEDSSADRPAPFFRRWEKEDDWEAFCDPTGPVRYFLVPRDKYQQFRNKLRQKDELLKFMKLRSATRVKFFLAEIKDGDLWGPNSFQPMFPDVLYGGNWLFDGAVTFTLGLELKLEPIWNMALPGKKGGASSSALKPVIKALQWMECSATGSLGFPVGFKINREAGGAYKFTFDCGIDVKLSLTACGFSCGFTFFSGKPYTYARFLNVPNSGAYPMSRLWHGNTVVFEQVKNWYVPPKRKASAPSSDSSSPLSDLPDLEYYLDIDEDEDL